ncbi:lasso peptide biosynthesis B2 protein [Mastigocladopsis repens]|uniref:lasso peptide biosynthesis B2 protein n=1 Tax=Mastigocladopsis repens TaxID=221287 RepID=UPI00030DDCC0|nr:lasso peptide biosynthesis B2 protein [Mastigocladopsis repens]
MKQLHNYFKLSGGDRNLLAITFILLTAIRLGLFFLAFRNLLKLLQKISQQNFRFPFETHKSQISVGKIVWAVNVATRYMPRGAKCLARALTTQLLMSHYGYSSELRIGVAKKEGGQLEAHAWIEYQGRVALGYLPDLSRFIPLPSLEGVKL